MPTPALKSMADKYGISPSKLERYWEDAKNSDSCKKYEEGSDRFYKCVMGVVKKRAQVASAAKKKKGE